MTLQNTSERAERIESEYKKWEEKYHIPFDQEFEIRTIIDLEDEFKSITPEHTKRRDDVIKMISHLKGRLNLKENSDSQKAMVMVSGLSGSELTLINKKIQDSRLLSIINKINEFSNITTATTDDTLKFIERNIEHIDRETVSLNEALSHFALLNTYRIPCKQARNALYTIYERKELHYDQFTFDEIVKRMNVMESMVRDNFLHDLTGNLHLSSGSVLFSKYNECYDTQRKLKEVLKNKRK